MQQDDLLNIDESILLLIDEFIHNNLKFFCKYDFNEKIINYVFDNIIILVYIENLWDIINENLKYYFQTIGIPRSYINSPIIQKINIPIIQKKLENLKLIKQPEQRTTEWYLFRHEHLTASSIWKSLSTQSNKNQLIYQKCAPINIHKYKVNINSPLHHRQKYEPVTTMIYELTYNTIVSEWGCIENKNYPFIAASPDGIKNKKDNLRYGRMFEIKNIVNREITKIPKEEYWIQMQIQMDTCDINECDFVETRFTEYETEEEFENDGTFTKSLDNKQKGIIVCFYDKKGPVYKYAPINITKSKFTEWSNKCIEEETNMTWIKNIYWKLDEISCILVPRNKLWFNSVIQDIKNIWDIILYERKHGYEHRKPKKRKKKNKENILIIKTETLQSTQLQ